MARGEHKKPKRVQTARMKADAVRKKAAHPTGGASYDNPRTREVCGAPKVGAEHLTHRILTLSLKCREGGGPGGRTCRTQKTKFGKSVWRGKGGGGKVRRA